jgi:hypothetical protein
MLEGEVRQFEPARLLAIARSIIAERILPFLNQKA